MEIHLSEKPMLKAIDECIKIIQLDDSITTQEDIVDYARNKDDRLQLKIMFKNYFKGAQIFDGVNVSEKNKDRLEIMHEEFLSLYKFLNYGWLEIKEVFSNITQNVKTPGEAFIYLLTERTKKSWAARGKSPNPQTLYRGYKEMKKLESIQSDSEATPKEIESQRSKVQTYYKRMAKNTGRAVSSQGDAEFILELCIDICGKSKNKSVKKALREYKDKLLQSEEYTLKMLRQRF